MGDLVKRIIVILVTALLIAGMREVCMAQYSQDASVERAATKKSNNTQLQERIPGAFVLRVKKLLFKTSKRAASRPECIADSFERPSLNTVESERRSFAAVPVRIDSEVTTRRGRR